MVTAMTDEEEQKQSEQQRWRKLAAEQEGTLLFETAGESHSGRSYLFQHPLRCLVAEDERSLATLYVELTKTLNAGYYVAGLLRYEAGYIFERIRNRQSAKEPLAWFGVYQEPEIADQATTQACSLLPDPLCIEMETSLSEYLRRVASIKRYIEAGDTYQVNLTTAMQSTYLGSALDLYTALAAQQPAPYSALLHLPDDEIVLSFSPELFFSRDTDRTITVRPMKGTAPLQELSKADLPQSVWLAADEKNRAEHLMIVDLLRSDLGRLCAPGSILANPLFAVERYRTLLQMTSTITGSLREAASLEDIFRALFPSGSMTGAPKPRTMEIICELETRPRGVYSGAIGFAAPDGTAIFNVAIRTVVLKDRLLRMGVGGGIVADSVGAEEHAECWLKSEFLRRASPPFSLVETLLWDRGFPLLESHLDRLRASAEQLNFALDLSYVRQQLLGAVNHVSEPCRVRLVLERSGQVTLTIATAKAWSSPLRLRLSPETIWSLDSFLHHKTTYRPLYDREFQEAQHSGFDEVIFHNERGELTEGSISTLLLRIDETWRTAPLHCGVLPGVARRKLLQGEEVSEAVLSLLDLARAEAAAVCNSVRGIGRVHSIEMPDGQVLHFRDTLPLPTIE